MRRLAAWCTRGAGSRRAADPQSSNTKAGGSEGSPMMDQSQAGFSNNIILNHNFSRGLDFWHSNSCHAYVASARVGLLNGIAPNSGEDYAVLTKRTQKWQGLEQDITGKVTINKTYIVSATVRTYGEIYQSDEVQATLRLEYLDSPTDYLFVGRALVSRDNWVKLEGTFILKRMPKLAVFYLEGPAPGIDLLIDSVMVSCSDLKHLEEIVDDECTIYEEKNIIENSCFGSGLNNWSGRGCKISLHSSLGEVRPLSGQSFASANGRSHSWNGIQQDITRRVLRKLSYDLIAVIRLFGNASASEVKATVWVQASNGREQYIGIGKVHASDQEWAQLKGRFILNGLFTKAVVYLEGPPPGVDILLNSLVVKRAKKMRASPPPGIENVLHGVNIIENSTYSHGLDMWHPMGSCRLIRHSGAPQCLPPAAKVSLGDNVRLSGLFVLASHRSETWMGPSQTITHKLKLHVTYQISAWVRVGSTASGPQTVNVAFNVDNKWINGGQVEAHGDAWHEIASSVRIEEKPEKVVIYVQGPSPGVDLMVSGLLVFPVDRKARFDHLAKQIDKIRKRDVVLKFASPDASSHLLGLPVTIRQVQNSFPFGSCINRSDIDNEEFVDFFLKNFNWAVFGNELKWYSTEPERGKLNYHGADELLHFCARHGLQVRGHCIFWEVENSVQTWVRGLRNDELMSAVESRLKGLLPRYKGKFRHYDVNNEMLHGSFFQDRLGKDIWAYMFMEAHLLDPSATLFVNDYNVEDGRDVKSAPERFVQQVLELQERGAPVGGIGVQAHIEHPVGPVVCAAYDKLAVLGLPIWLTELDVKAANEHVRADDLEVILREAYAHPAVEGIVLWGFMDIGMWKPNTHLVDADGVPNEAGRRYLALKQEWLTNAAGQIDEHGGFGFRGHHGTYVAEIGTLGGKTVSHHFTVDRGDSPLILDVKL